MILVDTNVLLDVLTDDPVWYEWSFARLEVAIGRGQAVINDIVYAELAVRFDGFEQLNRFVAASGLIQRPMPKQALFLAGKAFGAYRTYFPDIDLLTPES